MNPRIAELTSTIHRLEAELEVEFARRRLQLAYTVNAGKIRFEEHALVFHRKVRRRALGYLLGSRPLMVVTAPLIYAMIVPFCLLDLMVSGYQHLCFPVYGIAPVRRSDHVVYDRGHLAYLNVIEKFNCLYCSYANGVVGYVREVAARTEQYWCPIKHARRVLGAHERYRLFADYGDAGSYPQDLARLRDELRGERDAT